MRRQCRLHRLGIARDNTLSDVRISRNDQIVQPARFLDKEEILLNWLLVTPVHCYQKLVVKKEMHS